MASYNNSNVTTGYNDPEGTHGPHSSKLANSMDPTVDSDRDHRSAPHSTGYTSGTGAAHNTNLTGAHSSTAGTATTTHAGTGAGNTGERTAQGIKGVFAQAHGVGEALRGNINSAIDNFTGDTAKQAHDEEVARGGFREVQNKEFEKRGTSDKAL